MSDISVTVTNQPAIQVSPDLTSGGAVSVTVVTTPIQVEAALNSIATAQIGNLYDANSNGIVDNAEAVGGKTYSDLQNEFVPQTRTVNGHALTANITVTKSDVSLGNVDNVQQMPLSYLDTDGALAANSDTKVPSQQAVIEYVAANAGGGDASVITYTPNTLADWSGSADPGNTDAALDQLASRTTDLEAAAPPASAFTDLTDVPASYTGQSGKVATVKGTEDGLEFTAMPEGLQVDASSGTGTTYGALSGLINGSNTTYTVSKGSYTSGNLAVYLNGQLQTQGSGQDWTETTPGSGTFDFVTAPIAGDVILAVYGAVGGGGSSSSLNVLSRDKDVSSGTYSNARTEYQSVAAGATQTILNYSGGSPGLVTRIFLAIQVSSADTAAIRGSQLKIYYDGNVSADIDVPINLFFGAEYMGDGNVSSFASEFIGANSAYDQKSASYYANIPIPFNTGIKIDVVNGSGSNSIANLFAEVDYYTGVANNWTNGKKLQVASGTLTNQAVNTVISLVDVSGINPGRLLGVYAAIDGTPNSANPVGAAVEGNFKIYKDGAGSPFYQSSGFEDFFGFGFGFNGGSAYGNSFTPTVGPYTGFTFRSGTYGTFQAYRFHIMDPIYFSSGLKVTWNCGDSSQTNFTGGERVAWAVWYYTS